MMRIRHICLCILNISFLYGEVNAAGEPNKEKTDGGYKYELFKSGMVLENAIAACKSRNAWLVEIQYKEINDVVKSLSPSHAVLIGGKFDNGWKWNDGSPMRYTNWASNHPLSTIPGRCLIADNQKNDWKYKECEGSRQRYICQSDASRGNCTDEICSNRGTCSITGQRYKCTCVKGYFGTRCEKRIIEISSVKTTSNVKRGQSLEISFTIVSYDGNVNVQARDIDTVSTLSITSSQVSENVKINFGPIESAATTIDYIVTAVSQTNDKINSDIKITFNIQDHCTSNPCFNGACDYITTSPYFTCSCTPAFNGFTCSDRVFRELNNCIYHVNYDKLASFDKASITCTSITKFGNEGTLAMMKSTEIQNLVEDQVVTQYGTGTTIAFWIGGTIQTKSWEWIDNTSIPLTGENAMWAWSTEYLPEPRLDNYLVLSSFNDEMRRNMKWYSKSGGQKYGYVCEVPKKNPCESLQCKNGGSCTAIGCQAICNCGPGYNGASCELDIFTIFTENLNFTSTLGKNIIVNLNISSYKDSLKIDVFKVSIASNAISTVYNVKDTVDILIGPFKAQSFGTKYVFRATPQSDPRSFYKFTSINVIVQGPAKIEEIEPRILAVPNKNKYSVIKCEATGVPLPTVHWYKDGNLVTKNSVNNIYQKQSTGQALLFVNSETRIKFGYYTCISYNSINDKTTFSNDTAFVRGKIKFVSSLLTNEPLTGSVAITCIYEGYPRPNIEWKLLRQNTALEIIPSKIFGLRTIVSTTSGFVSVNSQFNIRLVEYLGHANLTCSGGNAYENETYDIGINTNLVLNRNRAFRFFNFTKKRNYSEAQNYCRRIESNLTKITDKETQTILAHAATKQGTGDRVYIGAQKHMEEGLLIWKWHDQDFLYNETKHKRWIGAPSTIVDGSYVTWKKYSPTGVEKCLTLAKTDNWQWTDSDCSKVVNFICEKRISGIPWIFESKVEECSSNIIIKLKTAPETAGIRHRIDVTEPNAQLVYSEVIVPTTENIIIERKVINLRHWTSYNVTITVCPDLCTYPSITTTTLTTHAGIPGPVTSANVVQMNTTCLILWKMDFVPGIIGFKIKAVWTVINDQHKRYFGDKFVENRIVPYGEKYQFKYNYNRNYKFDVQALTCTGAGSSHQVIGHCATQTGPPDKVLSPVAAPQTNADDTIDITVPFPEELNGPISCLFVIVVFMPNQTTEVGKIINIEELINTMLNTNLKQLLKNGRYIAIAISRPEIEEEIIQNKDILKQLGDGSASACNLTQRKNSYRMKRETESVTNIRANNAKLQNDATYSCYLLSTTSGNNGELYFKASNTSYFKKVRYQNPNNDSTVILSISIVAVLIVVLVIVILSFLRYKKSIDHEPNNAISMTTVRTQVVPEPDYENLEMDKPEHGSKTEIPLFRVLDAFNSMIADDSFKFYEEFEKLNETTNSFRCSTQSALSQQHKNRCNILPYDHSRVVMEDGNYINANYVNGFDNRKKYIAAQGPLPNTVAEYWMMLFEQNANVIVMLTKCEENGERKCEKYWPELGFSKQHGSITITTVEEKSYGSFKFRSFKVMKDDEERKILQMQFLDWPDHSTPSTTTNFIRFCDLITEQESSDLIVVHCSDGAERTGAFIAYNNLLEESKTLNKVDVFECVLALRKQRMNMVPTCEQYMFVHKLIVEHHLYGVTDMDPKELENMVERSPDVLSKQYKNLSIIGPINRFKHRVGDKISAMNRRNDICPYENNHVSITRLREDSDVPYVNASTIESYCNAFKLLVAAQGPMKNTLEYFWRAIIDNNINTIIMLTKCLEKKKEQCYQYWPTNQYAEMKVDNITIQLQNENIDGVIAQREILVKRKDYQRIIKQYHYTDWSSNECPESASIVIEIIEKMQSSLQKVKNASVLVHCSDGAGRTGAFCAILNLIERLKRESRVDVFRTVKDLRDCRPGMVQILDQYRFCFKAVSEYYKMFSAYATIDENDKGISAENPYLTAI